MRALVNDNVLNLPPYRPNALAPEYEDRPWVRLSANENPFPLPDSLFLALNDSLKASTRYPDSSALFLRQALAHRHGLAPEQVLIGAGSTELISMSVAAFLKPTEKVLTSESTFLMYRLATIARAGLGALLETPLSEEMAIDLSAMSRRLQERVKLVFIANPNNPTGTHLSCQEIADFSSSLPKNTLLILDNAYQEYVDDPAQNGVSLLKDHDNIIVLRTFSKVYGLASLRIGYALASAHLIDYFNRVKPPFNVSGLAQSAALAALGERAYVEGSVVNNRSERQRLFNVLAGFGMRVIPSQANFLLFMPPGDTGKLCQRFKKDNILLRPGSPFGLPGALRVSIGQPAENDRFLLTLQKLLG